MNRIIKKVNFISATLFVFFSFVLSIDGLAWDDGVTHKDLSEFAAENSVISKSKGDYLKKLGFEKGLDEIFKWGEAEQKVRKWLRAGAELEDSSGPLSVGRRKGPIRRTSTKKTGHGTRQESIFILL